MSGFAPVACALAAATISAPPSEEAFRRDYAQQATRIIAFYSSLIVCARESFMNDPGGDIHRLDATYWGGGDRSALEFLYRTDMPDTDRWFDGGRSVWVAAPDCSFALRANRDATLALGDLRRDSAGYRRMLTTIRSRGRFASAPYAVLDDVVASELGTKHFRITAITDEPDAVTRVSWKDPIPDVDRYGWYDFLPQSGWVLTGYEIAMHAANSKYPIPTKLCAKIDYATDARFPFPVVRHAEYWTEKPQDGGTRSQVYVFDVTSVQPGPPDAGVFDLAHYDMGSVRRTPSTLYWLTAALAAAVVGAIVFRYLANRRKEA